MKNALFNVAFTAIFLGMFSLILYIFSDTLIGAITSKQTLYPKDKSLAIDSCQKWTDDVTDHNVKSGEEANRLTVLVYNRIIDEEQLNETHFTNDESLQSTIVVTAEFEKQMAFLATHNYTSLTAEEFYLFMQNKIKVPQKSILITFDDGLKDNLDTAYPILKNINLLRLTLSIRVRLQKRTVKLSSLFTIYKKAAMFLTFKVIPITFIKETKTAKHI